MRNGNISIALAFVIGSFVLTVPMRNGNITIPPSATTLYLSFLPYLWGMETPIHSTESLPPSRSYRTYEEWKPRLNSSFQNSKSGFLPYLWGMETRYSKTSRVVERYSSYRTYEEWKQPSSKLIFRATFLFLPYLWGMETLETNLFLPHLTGSYRTYEEWKPRFWEKDIRSRLEFLPYLWGMETDIRAEWTGDNHRSYRTYEEWKLLEGLYTCPFVNRVLTVPMRNGNETERIFQHKCQVSSYRTYEEWKHSLSF